MTDRPYPNHKPRDLGGTDVVTARAALRQQTTSDDAEILIDVYMHALADRLRHYAEKTAGIGEAEAHEAVGMRDGADLIDSWRLHPVSSEEQTG